MNAITANNISHEEITEKKVGVEEKCTFIFFNERKIEETKETTGTLYRKKTPLFILYQRNDEIARVNNFMGNFGNEID